MNNRNGILLGVLILQLVLIGSLYRPGQEEAPEHAFFPDLAAEEIHGITIADDDEGTITLAKEDGAWQVAAVRGPGAVSEMAPPVPADTAKVEELARKLAGLHSRRLVSRTKGSQARLKVAADRFVRKIELTTPGGDPQTIFLGSAPSYQTIHARQAGADEVYLAAGLTAWEAAADLPSWWRTDYLDLEPEKLQAVTLDNQAGTLRLVRSEEGGWQLAAGDGETALRQEAVAEFLNRMSYLAVSDYVGREGGIREAAYGLSKPAARLVLDSGAEQVELRIGPEVRDSDERVVKSSASPYYVKVAALSLQPVLEQSRKALLLGEEETEQAAATAPGAD